MTDQLLAVQARLVQDDQRVDEVAVLCATGPYPWAVQRLTAAMIYVACGMRITRCRKVVKDAQMALRGHSRITERQAQRYEQRLLKNALVLARASRMARIEIDQVREVKARLLLATAPDAVRQIKEYSGIGELFLAAVILAATDGDVAKCKAEIERFWTDRNYVGPLAWETESRSTLEDTM